MTSISYSNALGLATTVRDASLHYFDIKEWRIEPDQQFRV